MKILVTGGCGFIGSHLVDKLVKQGHDVAALDNLSAGKKENLNKAAKFIRGDVRDEDDVRKALKGCEVVFHLAAIADAMDEKVYGTNFLGSQNVFSLAKRNNAKIIFTSSAAVYGNVKLPCRESSECKPVSLYGKSKLKAENILKKHKEYFIARLFNVYGPGGKGVVNNFCERIPEYKDITVFGGLRTRDFVYVSDVVDALLLGMENSGLYNVGSGTETSLFQLIDTIHAISSCKPSVKFAPEKKEIKRSKADITKIKTLGWQPRISLQEGIRLTVEALGIKDIAVQ